MIFDRSMFQNLWREAQTYPLYTLLKDKNSYVFMTILQTADKVCEQVKLMQYLIREGWGVIISPN